jgi:hypothetical protein
MSSVSISHDGAKVVDVGSLGALRRREAGASLALFPVVEELGHEEVLDLVGNGVGRVVCR